MRNVFLSAIISCLLSQTAFCQICDNYQHAQTEIQKLKKQFEKNMANETLEQIKAKSKIAALLLEQCLGQQQNLSDKDKLMINYQIGKYYFDAGDCQNTQKYFNICLALSSCSTEKFNSTYSSYQDVILRKTRNQFCANMVSENISGSKIVRVIISKYSGKAMFEHPDKDKGTDELDDLNTVINMPYLSDEIDELNRMPIRRNWIHYSI